MSECKIITADCLKYLKEEKDTRFHLTFLDPPFNQGKDYRHFNDAQSREQYWKWLKEVLSEIYRLTEAGGSIYFMQREKNTEAVLASLRETGWTFQNLIIWKKKTSAVPGEFRFSKHYQIIAFATKGKRPRVFHRLRIDLPAPPEYSQKRENGVFVTDVWDDIRELTSGYFAGDEALRNAMNERLHTQQSPVALLLRILLASSELEDYVLDPFAGTGTTLVVAHQLGRNGIGIEIDPEYVTLAQNRLATLRPADDVSKYYEYYKFTENLPAIWNLKTTLSVKKKTPPDAVKLF